MDLFLFLINNTHPALYDAMDVRISKQFLVIGRRKDLADLVGLAVEVRETCQDFTLTAWGELAESAAAVLAMVFRAIRDLRRLCEATERSLGHLIIQILPSRAA